VNRIIHDLTFTENGPHLSRVNCVPGPRRRWLFIASVSNLIAPPSDGGDMQLAPDADMPYTPRHRVKITTANFAELGLSVVTSSINLLVTVPGATLIEVKARVVELGPDPFG
jgi:hypothetical protein